MLVNIRFKGCLKLQKIDCDNFILHFHLLDLNKILKSSDFLLYFLNIKDYFDVYFISSKSYQFGLSIQHRVVSSLNIFENKMASINDFQQGA